MDAQDTEGHEQSQVVSRMPQATNAGETPAVLSGSLVGCFFLVHERLGRREDVVHQQR
jgi:hypothetical protein